MEQIGGNGYGYGIYFLNSPITFGLMILKNVGLIEYPAGFLTVQSSINALQNYTKVGNNWFNSFATCFYYFYRDGGFVGIIIESGIYGFFSYRTFKNLKEKSQAREIILYSVILITIFTSMVRWQFGRPEFFMVVVYIMLLTKKHSKRG